MSRRLISIVALIVALLIPFPTTVVPEWKLRAIDENGQPVSGIRARQSWKHYSLEWEGCCPDMEDRWTDENGHVVFPRRLIWAGLLQRAVFPVLAAVSTLAHGSTGIHAYVMISGDKEGTKDLDYKLDKPLPQEVIIRR